MVSRPADSDSAALQARIREACAAALAGADALALGAVRDGMLVYASPALARILGLADPQSPRSLSEFVVEADRQQVGRALSSSNEPVVNLRAMRADGSLFEAQLLVGRGELPDGPAMVIALHDVDALRGDPRRLSYAELYDTGCGLPNRRLFFDRVQQAVIDAARSGRRAVVMVVEAVGLASPPDAALRRLGTGLQNCLRESDTVARLEQTRLGILLPRLAVREQATRPAERMAATLKETGESMPLRIGIAAYPDDASTPERLLEQATTALQEALQENRDVLFASAAPTRELPARVPWSPRYEVGIEVIDGQHRQLLELVNRLGDDLGAGRDFDQLVESLRELVRYTEHHFATEERLMDEIGAGAERHRSEHRRLIDGLMRYTVNLDAASVSRSSRFLQDWLFRHIEEVDRPFAAFLRSRGVK